MKELFQGIILYKIPGIAAGWLLAMAVTLQQDPGDCAMLMAAFSLLGALAVTFGDPKLQWLPRLTPLWLLLPLRPVFLLCAIAAFTGGTLRLAGGRQLLYFSGISTGVLLALFAGDTLYRPGATAAAIALLTPALFALTISKLPLTRSGKILFPLLFFLAAAVNLLVFLVRDGNRNTTIHAAGTYGAWHMQSIPQTGSEKSFSYTIGNWQCRMPDDMLRRRESVLPAALQCAVPHSRILFVAAAPSATAKYFQDLPWVDQVFFLLEGFPEQLLSREVRQTVYSGMEELKKIPRDIDLIYCSELPPMPPEARRTLLQKFRDFAPDAPVILPRSHADGLADWHPLPGCADSMIIWGGKAPALTFAALEKRLAQYDPGQTVLPGGILQTLYSLADDAPEPPPEPRSLLRKSQNSLLCTIPLIRHWIFPPILLGGLLLLRFALERYPSAGNNSICMMDAAAYMAGLLLLVNGAADHPDFLWGRSPALLLAMALAIPPGAPGRGRGGIPLVLALAAAATGLYREEPLWIVGALLLLHAAAFCPLQETGIRSRYLHFLGLLFGVIVFCILPPGASGILYAGALLLPHFWRHSNSSSSVKR